MTELLSALQQFHFLRPLWLLAVIAVILALWLLKRHESRTGAWGRVIAPQLLPFLVSGPGNNPLALPKKWLMAGGILTCLALAGPTWQKIPLPVHKQQGALVILFDLSPSMLAEDIKPNRLTRARLKAIDLLQQYREGSVALVAYAGDAHVVTPLTNDGNTLIALLPSLHPDLMPEAGSNPEQALEKGLELVMNTGQLEGDILFITDGMTQAAQENLRRMLQGMGDFRLSILGVGTDEGAPIPLGSSGFARDGRGAIIVASLGSGPLQGLAQRSGGRYSTITSDDSDIQYLLSPLADRKNQDTKVLERTIDTWDDKGYWLVLALLPLLILAFRRGVLALVLAAPLLYSPASDASLWDDLWSTRDQQGIKALENEQPGKALELFDDNLWRGIAAYRNGDYRAAEQSFEAEPSATGHYNRGNALARQGKLQEAIDAYQQALALIPQMDDAASNKALVEAILKQQQEEQQEQQNQQQEIGDSGQQPESSQSSQQQDSQGESQPQSEVDKGADENGDGKQQSQQQSGQQSGQQANEQSADGQVNGGNPEQQSDPEHPRESGKSTENREKNQAGQENTSAVTPEAGTTGSDETSKEVNREAPVTSAGENDAESVDESLEQWLRRVPDDPGGLLRRKFQYESRQRFLQQRQQRSLPPDQYSEERW